MIQLKPMTEDEFLKYAELSIHGFATESPRYRNVPAEEALKAVSEEFHTKMVPQGIRTPGHFLWQIYDDHERVGHLHLGEPIRPVARELFAWDFLIYEQFRRKGFARQAMIEAAKRVRELGYLRVALNVFGDNKAAIKLYETMGFRVTQVQMVRDLDTLPVS